MIKKICLLAGALCTSPGYPVTYLKDPSFHLLGDESWQHHKFFGATREYRERDRTVTKVDRYLHLRPALEREDQTWFGRLNLGGEWVNLYAKLDKVGGLPMLFKAEVSLGDDCDPLRVEIGIIELGAGVLTNEVFVIEDPTQWVTLQSSFPVWQENELADVYVYLRFESTGETLCSLQVDYFQVGSDALSLGGNGTRTKEFDGVVTTVED